MKKYDYLVVGSGLYGAVFAREAKKAGKSVLVIDKRPNIAGNVYTEDVEKIHVHKYGAHIFHTNNKKVWNYITQFAEFNRFTNSPVANYKGELYSLPFNMYTFNKMWGVVTPEEAEAKIEEQRKEITGEPKNLEEQAVSLVGRDIYEKLINSIKSIDLEAIRLLFQLKTTSFWKKINGNFLLSVLCGIGISIFSLAKLMTYLLTHHPIEPWSCFLGFIIGSAFLVGKEI